jgi:peroxiredoxin
LAISKVPDPLLTIVPFRQLWLFARAGDLRVGDPAPDFHLETIDRRDRVQLSSFRGREPVVLVFGSYT